MKHAKLISRGRGVPRRAEVDPILAKQTKLYLLDYTMYVIRQYVTGSHVLEDSK